MLTKILFTAAVILAAVVYVRQRGSSGSGQRPDRSAQARPPVPWYWRLAPTILVLGVLAVGGLVFWLEWQSEHEVFTVRVVDTRTGEVRTYPVYRDQVEGRRFTTIDGRVVTLADVERMELIEGAPDGPPEGRTGP